MFDFEGKGEGSGGRGGRARIDMSVKSCIGVAVK